MLTRERETSCNNDTSCRHKEDAIAKSEGEANCQTLTHEKKTHSSCVFDVLLLLTLRLQRSLVDHLLLCATLLKSAHKHEMLR